MRCRTKQEMKHFLWWKAGLIKRSDGVCENCYKVPGHTPHHDIYIRWGRERLMDGRWVCRDCHTFLHARDSARARFIPMANRVKEWMDDYHEDGPDWEYTLTLFEATLIRRDYEDFKVLPECLTSSASKRTLSEKSSAVAS